MKQKREYEKKLEKKLEEAEKELKNLFKEEWKGLEREAKKEEQVRKIKNAASEGGKILLKLLFLGGVCSVALVAPNVFVAYDRLNKQKAYLHKNNIRRGMRSLQKQKDIEAVKVGEHEYEITLTEEGRRKARKIAFQELGKSKQKKWDGWWRLVIFDIPEKYKKERDAFRQKIESMGFRRLQRSVFISPYPCEEIVEFTLTVFGIEKYVTIIKTQQISETKELCQIFQI